VEGAIMLQTRPAKTLEDR